MNCAPAWAWALVFALSWLCGAFFGISEQAAKRKGIDPLDNRVIALCLASFLIPLAVTILVALTT